jgi:hypothetical protein
MEKYILDKYGEWVLDHNSLTLFLFINVYPHGLACLLLC